MAQKKRLFEEYIQNGTPEQKKRAENWALAIGLQAVDGLIVSDFLLELARKNIEGELTSEEVSERLEDYYNKKHTEKATSFFDNSYEVCTDPSMTSKGGRPI